VSADPSYPQPFSPHDPDDPIFVYHRGGKLEVASRRPLTDRAELSIAYTPGVAEVSRANHRHTKITGWSQYASRR
jgi:malate dehydrogenase (oxaloacetate-decarboxylating)